MHGAMDNNRRRAGLVGADDLGDIGRVCGVGIALIVDDDVIVLGPVGIVEKLRLKVLRVAAFVDDGPIDGGSLG